MKYPYIPVFALTLLIVATVSSPEQTMAHGEEGLTFSATSTTEGGAPYIVDVDYSDLVIEAERIGRFDFNLFLDQERTKPVEFTDMWVRITRNDGERGRTVFAGGVAKQQFGGNGFSYVFAEGGQYTLSVRYNDANIDKFGETVAEAEFSLDVLRSDDEDTFKFDSMEFWVGLIGGLFTALLGVLPLLLGRRKS